MDLQVTHREEDIGAASYQGRPKSAASWGAIFAGSLVAIALSLVLMALGAGLGFASMSPWPNHGLSAGTFTMTAAIWLIVTQWVSSIFGGYITGRLRIRWSGTHEHEIFFRDTANGLVMWALSTVLVAAVATSFVSSVVGVGAKSVFGAAASGSPGEPPNGQAVNGQGAAASGLASSALAYGIDKLFRPSGAGGASGDSGGPSPTSPSQGAGGAAAGNLGADPRATARHIIVNDLETGGFPEADRAYLVRLVASHTGLAEADAQKRVNHLIDSANAAEAKVKAEADVARKEGAEVAIYTALALLIGAFIASAAAALGGRLREEHL
jgi:hypothetical protein